MRAMLLFLLVGLGLLASPALAETYKYVDDSGQIHFVDSAHAIPQQYRSQVQELVPEPEDTGFLGMSGAMKDQSRLTTKIMTDVINDLRRQQGKLGLDHDQKRELRSFIGTWMPALVISHSLLLLVWLAVVLHGFIQGHPVWAIVNILFGAITIPIYAFIHIGDDSRGLKMFITAAALAPAIVLGYSVYQLMTLTLRLAGLQT